MVRSRLVEFGFTGETSSMTVVEVFARENLLTIITCDKPYKKTLSDQKDLKSVNTINDITFQNL